MTPEALAKLDPVSREQYLNLQRDKDIKDLQETSIETKILVGQVIMDITHLEEEQHRMQSTINSNTSKSKKNESIIKMPKLKEKKSWYDRFFNET